MNRKPNISVRQSHYYSCQFSAISAFYLALDLNSDQKAELSHFLKCHRFLERGERLFMLGDHFRSLYIVHSGSVKAQLLASNGTEQITGFHLPGELLGVDGFASGKHTHSIEALETSNICEVSFDGLELLMVKNRSILRRFLSIISQAIIDEQNMLLSLGQFSAEQRLAKFLLNLSHKMNARGFSANEFQLSMSRYDIANYLGLAVETVSRILTRFQHDSIITVQRRWVEIVDLEKLWSCVNINTESATKVYPKAVSQEHLLVQVQ